MGETTSTLHFRPPIDSWSIWLFVSFWLTSNFIGFTGIFLNLHSLLSSLNFSRNLPLSLPDFCTQIRFSTNISIKGTTNSTLIQALMQSIPISLLIIATLWRARYATASEDLILNYPSALIGPLLVVSHPITGCVFMFLRMWESLEIHSG